MSRYIRANTPGPTYFFTVTLLDRRSPWLVDHAPLLRECLAATKADHPFRIDAMVVLPDHVHAIWTLPEQDADFSLRWMLIKRRFTRQLLCRRLLDPASSLPGAEPSAPCGNAASGSTRSATTTISHGTSSTSISIR